MPYETVLTEKEDGVLILTFNRPEKLNSLEARLLREAAGALQEANHDDEVQVAVITGAGRAFCSGADLTAPVSGIEYNQPDINRNIRLQPYVSFGWLMEQIEGFGKPVIAAVNGIASGAGLAIAAACDIRIASEDARFSSIFVKRGLVPDCGTTYYVPRLVGISKALELMWSGDFVDAREAERIGLVNRVVPADTLMTEAREYARRLARGPSVAIELIKRLTYDSLRASTLTVQLGNESDATNLCRQTEDFQEGIKAFLEKREPRFKGR